MKQKGLAALRCHALNILPINYGFRSAALFAEAPLVCAIEI
jgi:hypothetical protein